MSDTEQQPDTDSVGNSGGVATTIVKEKRKLSPEHLEKLKAAREKGLATIKANRERRKQINQIAKKEINKNYEKAIAKKNEKPEPVPEPVPEPEEESDPEPVKAVIKKKKKTPKRVVYKYESDSSDSEAEIIIKRRSNKKKYRSPPAEKQEIFPEAEKPVAKEEPAQPAQPSYQDYLLAEKLRAIRMINPNFRGFGN